MIPSLWWFPSSLKSWMVVLGLVARCLVHGGVEVLRVVVLLSLMFGAGRIVMDDLAGRS